MMFPILNPATRLVVIGNSGSGKSTFAERTAAMVDLAMHDLDLIHWHTDGRKRDEAEAKALATNVASGEAWVIEGVYGWLVEVVLARATALVWLDLPWADCREGLLRRGPRRSMMPGSQDALLTCAGAYWTRTTPSSFAGHQHLYESFSGDKAHLRTRAEVSAFSSRGYRI